jgi:hypothetical protein
VGGGERVDEGVEEVGGQPLAEAVGAGVQGVAGGDAQPLLRCRDGVQRGGRQAALPRPQRRPRAAHRLPLFPPPSVFCCPPPAPFLKPLNFLLLAAFPYSQAFFKRLKPLSYLLPTACPSSKAFLSFLLLTAFPSPQAVQVFLLLTAGKLPEFSSLLSFLLLTAGKLPKFSNLSSSSAAHRRKISRILKPFQFFCCSPQENFRNSQAF